MTPLLVLAVLVATPADAPSVAAVPLAVVGADPNTVNQEFRFATFGAGHASKWLYADAVGSQDRDDIGTEASIIGAKAGVDLVLVGDVLVRGGNSTITVHLVDVEAARVVGTTQEAGGVPLKPAWARRTVELLLGTKPVAARFDGKIVDQRNDVKRFDTPAGIAVSGRFTTPTTLLVEVQRAIECLEEPVTTFNIEAQVGAGATDPISSLLDGLTGAKVAKLTYETVGDAREVQCPALPMARATVTVSQADVRKADGRTRADGTVTLALDGPLGFPPIITVRAAAGEDDEDSATLQIPSTTMLAQLSPTTTSLEEFDAFAQAFPEARLPDELESRRRRLTEAAEQERRSAEARAEEERRQYEAQAERDAKARRAAATTAWAHLKPRTLVSVSALIAEHGEENVPAAALKERDRLARDAEASLGALVRKLLDKGEVRAALGVITEGHAVGVPTNAARAMTVDAVSRALGGIVGPAIYARGGPKNAAEYHALRTLFGFRGGGAKDLWEALARAEKGDVVGGGLKAFVAQARAQPAGVGKLWLLSTLNGLGVAGGTALVEDLLAITDDSFL